MIPKNNPTVEVGRNVDLKNVSHGSLPKRSPPYNGGRKPLVRAPEPRPDLTKEEMREKLIGIKEIESVTGIRYIRLHVTAKMIIGIRESSGKEFTINLDELYKAYTQCNHFTSPEVKKYIFMGHSPAVALLRYLKNG